MDLYGIAKLRKKMWFGRRATGGRIWVYSGGPGRKFSFFRVSLWSFCFFLTLLESKPLNLKGLKNHSCLMGQEAVEQVPMVYLVLTGLVSLGLLVPWSKKSREFMKKIACSCEIRCLDHVETITEKVYAMARCCRSRSKSKGPWRDSFSRFGEVSINGGLLSKIGIHDDILWNSNPPLVEAFQPPRPQLPAGKKGTSKWHNQAPRGVSNEVI